MAVKHDPIEDDPQFENIISAAERDVEAELADVPRLKGFCHIYWYTKKKILKERYGIDWKSPTEIDPKMRFD